MSTVSSQGPDQGDVVFHTQSKEVTKDTLIKGGETHPKTKVRRRETTEPPSPAAMERFKKINEEAGKKEPRSSPKILSLAQYMDPELSEEEVIKGVDAEFRDYDLSLEESLGLVREGTGKRSTDKTVSSKQLNNVLSLSKEIVDKERVAKAQPKKITQAVMKAFTCQGTGEPESSYRLENSDMKENPVGWSQFYAKMCLLDQSKSLKEDKALIKNREQVLTSLVFGVAELKSIYYQLSPEDKTKVREMLKVLLSLEKKIIELR